MNTNTTLQTKLNDSQKLNANQKAEVKIFVIDDDPMYTQVLDHQLRKNDNYKVYSFKVGEECFKHIHLLSPDIVILDYRLNETNPKAMNGLEILKRIKRINPEIQVLMLSGHESFEVATSSIKNGAFDYIVKNETTFVRLQNLIDKILNNSRLQKIVLEQESHSKLIILAAVAVILIPMLSNQFTPNMAWWITLVAFAVLSVILIVAHRTKFINQDIK